MIPKAAVEAALDAYGSDGKLHVWERKMILDVLTAAAPHLLAEARAEAWDEGWGEGTLSKFSEADNPYRVQS